VRTLILSLLLIAAWPLHGAEYRLYFLGGQSNMEGYGRVAELPAALTGPVEGALIFDGRIAEDGQAGGGVGLWAPLEPGHGTGYRTDGVQQVLSDRFGPELPFARRLRELEPGVRVALVKYAKGGTALLEGGSGYGNWEPDSELGDGINQYDHALATLRNALAERDIDGDGSADTLVPAGILWMQGEADAYEDPVAARAYRDNLKRMMDLLRAALRTDDLPVVLGRIVDSGRDGDGLLMDYSPVVQRAQAEYAAADRCAALVDVSDGIGWSDDWHYDTASYLRLGRAFAEAVHGLQDACP
jgi:hypothetical protein